MNKIIFLVLLVFCSQAHASPHWTGYGKIKEINQQPNSQTADVLILADLPSNLTTCTVKNGFVFDVVTEKDKRMFSMLLSAFMAGKEVRLFVTDDCSIWDTPKVTGIYVK